MSMNAKEQRRSFLIGLILVAVTLAVYWPSTRYGFVVMDDDRYIYENEWLQKGFCWATLKWAFTTVYMANWHPMTWLSHLLDYTAYGLFAGGHHLTNVIFHATNTLLLFLLLKGVTRRFWPSATVAALFGWHPLHVESVAWVSERKDVLSTFFFLLTLLAYARYVEFRKRMSAQHSTYNAQQSTTLSPWPFYLLSLLFFALGLMSKPMLVTLPMVLLLLDYWPLERFQISNLRAQLASFRVLLIEKLPFIALALAVSVMTVVAQHGGGAIKSVEQVPLTLRILNAFAAYMRYLGDTIYPAGLCSFYPLSTTPLIALGIGSALVLGGITWGLFRLKTEHPWALVGWFWFLGTLVPVIGFVQVGMQSMADRYMYIPSIGLFVATVWAIENGVSRWHIAPRSLAAVTSVLLLACLGLTKHQLAYWQDSVTLFTRAVAVTRDNAVAENNLGVALAQRGETAEAIKHYREAVRVNPDYAQAHYNLGVQLAECRQLDKAAFHFSEASKLNPTSEVLRNNLGVILARQGKVDQAISQFQQAIWLNPRYPKPYLNYGGVLQSLGEAGAAATNYSKALEMEPDWPDALDKLAWLMATCQEPEWRRPEGAIQLASRAAELTQGAVPAYLDTLACAYAAAGQFSNAVAVAHTARDVALKDNLSSLAQKLDQDLESYRGARFPQVDWRAAR